MPFDCKIETTEELLKNVCIIASDFVDVVVFGVSLFLPCLTIIEEWFVHPHWYVCLTFQSEVSV